MSRRGDVLVPWLVAAGVGMDVLVALAGIGAGGRGVAGDFADYWDAAAALGRGSAYGGSLPYPQLPIVAWLVGGLRGLPFPVAFGLWDGAGLVAWGAAAWWVLRDGWLVALVLASPVVARVLVWGSASWVVAVGLLVVAFGGRRLGVVAAVAKAYLLPVLLLWCGRRWLAGLAVGACAVAAAFLVAGPGSVGQWLAYLSEPRGSQPDQVGLRGAMWAVPMACAAVAVLARAGDRLDWCCVLLVLLPYCHVTEVGVLLVPMVYRGVGWWAVPVWLWFSLLWLVPGVLYPVGVLVPLWLSMVGPVARRVGRRGG